MAKRKRNARKGGGRITVPFQWDTTPDERDFTDREMGEAAVRVLEEYVESPVFYEKMGAELGAPVRKGNPDEVTEAELTRRLKF